MNNLFFDDLNDIINLDCKNNLNSFNNEGISHENKYKLKIFNNMYDDFNKKIKLDFGSHQKNFYSEDSSFENKYNVLNKQYAELLENNNLIKKNNKLIKEKNIQLEDEIKKLKEQLHKINSNLFNLRILHLSILNNISLDTKK